MSNTCIVIVIVSCRLVASEELERKELSHQLEAFRLPDASKARKDGSAVLLSQFERCREQLLDSERSLRDVQA